MSESRVPPGRLGGTPDSGVADGIVTMVRLVHNSPQGALRIQGVSGVVDRGVPFDVPEDLAAGLLRQHELYRLADGESPSQALLALLKWQDREQHYRVVEQQARPSLKPLLARGHFRYVWVQCRAKSGGYHDAGAVIRVVLNESGEIVADLDASIYSPGVRPHAANYAGRVHSFQCSECGRRHDLHASDILKRATIALCTPTRVGDNYVTRVR